MRIDSSGRVGIGTTSPDTTLRVKGATNSLQVRFSGTDSRGLAISTFNVSDTNDNGVIYNAGLFSDGAQVFQCGGTERMRIDSSGNMSVGTGSSWSGDARIEGRRANGSGWGVSAYKTADVSVSGGALLCRVDSTSSSLIEFYYTGSSVGSITTNGSSTTYGTGSDYRLKENVTYNFDATTRLKQLKPARFNFIGYSNRTVDGFIAHEVQDIIPEAITGTKDQTQTKQKVVVNNIGQVIAENIEQADWEAGKILNEEGKSQYPIDSTWESSKIVPVHQGIDQAKLTPLLTKALQEAIAKIESLEARLTALES
jgi:hypothetical protein